MGQLTQDFTQVQDDFDGLYACIYVDDNLVAQTIATGASYTKVTAFATNGVSSNATPDAANDKITITKAGTYHITVSCSFTGATNGINWFGTVFVDGVEQSNIHFERKLGTGGDYGSATISGLVTIAANKDVDFRVRHDRGSNDDITVRYCTMQVHAVGQ